MNRRLLIGVGVVLALLLLIPIGRWERARHARAEVRGMTRIADEVGPLNSPRLRAYRRLFSFDCLLYARGKNPFALELCFDLHGRLIEAIDRSSGDPKIWSLREDPSRSTLRYQPQQIDFLLRYMGAPPRD